MVDVGELFGCSSLFSYIISSIIFEIVQLFFIKESTVYKSLNY